jgi:hypothetical protein
LVRIDDLAAELSAVGRPTFEARFGRHFIVFTDEELLDDAASFVNTASRDGNEILRGRTEEKLDVRAVLAAPKSRDPERVSVGRDKGCDIPVKHARVSSVHAHFSRGGGLLFVTDARSKNGTRVNGVQLIAGRPSPVDVGDTIQFGPVAATMWGIDDVVAAISRRG